MYSFYFTILDFKLWFTEIPEVFLVGVQTSGGVPCDVVDWHPCPLMLNSDSLLPLEAHLVLQEKTGSS